MKTRIREMVAEDRNSIIEIAKLLPQWFTQAGVEQIAQDVPVHQGFVALDNENVVGFVSYAPTKEKRTAELTWIGVRPEFHRRGIGRALVQAAEANLTERGFTVLEVSTVAPTTEYEPYARTRSFYYGVGFSDVRIDIKWFPSGDDRVLLRKQLTP